MITKGRGTAFKRLAIPSHLQTSVIKTCHDHSFHPGITKTFAIMQERFWWENMMKSIVTHVSSCSCRHDKPGAAKYNNFNKDHIVCTKRWQTIAIDWLDIGKTGKYGNTTVLTVIDLFTRFAIAIPSKGKTGNHLVKILRMLFAFYGYPERVVSDNEGMFRSEAFEEWLRVKGIDKTFTAVYNPKANGIDERFNQTILNMVNSTGHGKCWDEYIWDMFHFYNMVPHSTTKIAPFYMQFIREGRLPIDLTLPTSDEEVLTYTFSELKTELGREETKASNKILANIEAYHGKVDAKRNRKAKFKRFKEGEWVMVRIPHPETAAKSGLKAEGPYQIHRCLGKNTYKLKEATGKKLKFLVNGRRMAKINTRPAKAPEKVISPEIKWFKPQSLTTVKEKEAKGGFSTDTSDSTVSNSPVPAKLAPPAQPQIMTRGRRTQAPKIRKKEVKDAEETLRRMERTAAKRNARK